VAYICFTYKWGFFIKNKTMITLDVRDFFSENYSDIAYDYYNVCDNISKFCCSVDEPIHLNGLLRVRTEPALVFKNIVFVDSLVLDISISIKKIFPHLKKANQLCARTKIPDIGYIDDIHTFSWFVYYMEGPGLLAKKISDEIYLFEDDDYSKKIKVTEVII